jgi:TP901 family phage tail tape measure protein
VAGPVRISIVAEGRGARRELEQTAKTAERMGSRIGRSVSTAGRVGAAGAVTLAGGLAVIGKSAVQTESEFSQTMNLVGAATGSAAVEVGKLRDLAKDLGASTSFSANEAASAMLELAKAGLTPATIQAGALEGTLTLAAAGGTDLATAATVASNALNTFGLRGKDMASVAAALAGGANASSASVESLAYGLSQVGPGAINAGLSLQQTVGVLSAFDAAGIKGSDAGTSLKTMLSRLVPTTKTAAKAMDQFGLDFVDAQGNIDSITEVAQQLQDKLGGLSQAQRTQALAAIFGSDATRAATVLMKEGEKGLRGYIRATKDQGAAEKMAKARMAGTAGALERLSGAAETSKLVIGEALAPVVVRVSDYLSENMVPATEQAVQWVEAFIEQIRAIKGDPDGELGKIGAALEEVDWPKAIEGAKEIAASLTEIGSAVGASSIDVLGDTLKITGKALGFVADHSDELAAIMPFLIAGFVAYKGATVAARASTALLIPMRIAELAATRQQTIAIREMTVAMQQLALAQRMATQGQWINGQWYSSVRANERATRGAGAAAGAAAGRFTALGAAARGAAGIGGMGALALGAQQADDKTRILMTTIGGAATGFAVGGPWGALIGGAAGAALGIFSGKAEEAGDASLIAQGKVKDLADSLDGVTGAATAATRELIYLTLQERGALEAANTLGLSSRDLVGYILGQKGATERVNAALVTQEEQYISVLNAQTGMMQQVRISSAETQRQNDAVSLLSTTLGQNKKQLDSQVRSQREQIRATQDLRKLTETIPRRIVQKIEQTGVQPTIKGLAQVARQYRLTPRQIKTLIEVVGVDASVKQVRRATNALKDTAKTKPDLTPFQRSFTRGVSLIEGEATKGSRRVGESLRDGTRKARADLGQFRASVRSGADAARTEASSGGRSIGTSLSDGVVYGAASRSEAVRGAISAQVRSAIAAGKAAARSKSPSRETFDLGVDLGKGLELGVAARTPQSKKAGRDLIAATLAGITNGTSGVDTAIGRLTQLIEKRIDLKDSQKERRREREVLRGLDDEFKRLKRNAREQDKNAEALARARDRHKQLVEAAKAYAASIKDSFVGYGNVVGLGTIGDSNQVTSGRILSQLEARLAASKRFAELIKQLSGKLNATSLQQLIDAGVDGGLATAEAIAAGGASAVSQINQLTAQIAAAGGGLGSAMSDEFKQAGIDAAAGLVKGLEREQRQLDKAAQRIGATIVKAIKKELGIKSPSRVFRRVGDDSMAGLALGLDETYARRLGTRVGSGVGAGLQQGISRPRLTLDTPPTVKPAATSTVNINVTVNATVGSSPIATGQAVVKALDAYFSAGGTTTTRWVR